MKISSFAICFTILCLPILSAQGPIRQTVEDFGAGQFRTFSTAGHPKANGLDIVLRYPSSWNTQEGVRPNIVQNFVAPRGSNDTLMAVLSVSPVPAELRGFSDYEIGEWLLDPANLEEMLPAGANVISAVRTSYDGEPGLLFSYIMLQSRAGVELVTVLHSQWFVYRRNTVDFTVSYAIPMVGSPRPLEQSEADALAILAMLLGNTIVLMDKY